MVRNPVAKDVNDRGGDDCILGWLVGGLMPPQEFASWLDGMALRSDRPSCMEKKQRDVLAKQVRCLGKFGDRSESTVLR